MLYVMLFFFFKQKTAYEMRISDWSSDVCSSDLSARQCRSGAQRARTCFLRSPAQTICRAPSRINRLRPAKRRLRTLLGLIPAFFVLGSSSCRRHLGTKRSAFSTQQRGRIQKGALTRNASWPRCCNIEPASTEETRVGHEWISKG